jgi:hypothetical protein
LFCRTDFKNKPRSCRPATTTSENIEHFLIEKRIMKPCHCMSELEGKVEGKENYVVFKMIMINCFIDAYLYIKSTLPPTLAPAKINSLCLTMV